MATTTYKMPLTNVPQYMNITLKGVEYRLTCRWNNSPEAGWMIDLADSATNTPILNDLPLTTGLDLLEPFSYLGIGGSLIVYTDNDPDAVPTLDDLGVQSNLYFVTDNGQ